VPPAVLFHGTSISTLPRILDEGLQPRRRQYVHLTPDRQLATSVGVRHGKPCLVCVDASSAHADGVAFFKANFTFWLAMTVPPKYLSAGGS
jgi:putative RNA 2'-phosphotransferase